MRRQCQFTVKRFEVNYSNMGLELVTSCFMGSESYRLTYTGIIRRHKANIELPTG